MTHLLLEYDESVDAAYLTVSDEPWARRLLRSARGRGDTAAPVDGPL
jgi:hypothetical protein